MIMLKSLSIKVQLPRKICHYINKPHLLLSLNNNYTICPVSHRKQM